ncbi:unnamed protein product [Blepharisma stoltei]|uniref:Protein kinase domain-containing protein n=1 Tax=Blepharisma stoltei TaxID=1481888 RepID=A0AAU9JCT7_9CILI|nr:unnamed protein product [Blepharisma stoltei]
MAKPHNVSVVTGNSRVIEEESKHRFSYSATKVIGNGSFGVVYQASVNETGETVAIKKVFQDKRYKNRELAIMKELTHPNIIGLRHYFYTKGEKEEEVYLNVVMDYIPDTIYKVMKTYTKTGQQVPLILVKLYSYQILRALAHTHAVGICHRDVKPQNMLVNPTTHVLKLCDFGSAKRLIPGEQNVSYICSRYYRAPELIFGAVEYKESIDIWSAGCVTAELLIGKPVFPGESGVDQLVEILKVLGTPSREQIHDMNPNYREFKFPHVRAHPWSRVFGPDVPQEAKDFVSSVLVYSPQRRPHALEALLHPFFEELRQESTRLPDGAPLPDLFNWTPQELRSVSPNVIQNLTPAWYRR